MLSEATQKTALPGRLPEPAIWHRPKWLGAPVLALLCAALLVYGSLLPFGFDLTVHTEQAGGLWAAMAGVLSSPVWIASTSNASSFGVPGWASDLLLNLALYLPLGVLLRLSVSRLTGRRWLQIIAGAAAIVTMSWGIESAQSLIPGRFASLQDIVANSAGGLMGVLLGCLVSRAWRSSAFALYRLTARPRRTLNRYLKTRPRRILAVILMLVFDMGLIALVYFALAPVDGGGASDQAFGLIPFQRHFERSYDVGVWLLGREAVVYGLAGAMLMLPVLRGRTGRAFGWVVLSLCLMAVAAEALKPMAGGSSADVTGPVIALICGGLVLTAAFMLVHACRRSCRRLNEVSVRIERRGHRHNYRFSLRHDKA